MKIQQTWFIALLAVSFSFMVQASETKVTPEDSEASTAAQSAGEDVVPGSQDTPDIFDEDDAEIKAKTIPFKDLPRIPSSMDPQQQELFKSAHAGRLPEVKALVAEGVSVTYQDKEKRTALILAANNGHTSVVEFLYSKGSDINAMDKDGMTPLMYTAKRSFNETASFLLKNGAKVNVQNRKRKISALMLASAWGNEELVKMLLDKGADPTLSDMFGRNAAFYAEKRGHENITKILSESQASQQE